MVGGREKASKGSASNRRFYISLYQIGAVGRWGGGGVGGGGSGRVYTFANGNSLCKKVSI